jgi:hypothetical protein
MRLEKCRRLFNLPNLIRDEAAEFPEPSGKEGNVKTEAFIGLSGTGGFSISPSRSIITILL